MSKFVIENGILKASQIKPDDWRNRRCRKIVCTDEI